MSSWHCVQMSGLSMIDGIYICLWTRALSVCGCESSVLYVTCTCQRGTPHGIYLTYIATVHTTYIQCYGVILAPVTLTPDKYDDIHLHVMTILGSFHCHVKHQVCNSHGLWQINNSDPYTYSISLEYISFFVILSFVNLWDNWIPVTLSLNLDSIHSTVKWHLSTCASTYLYFLWVFWVPRTQTDLQTAFLLLQQKSTCKGIYVLDKPRTLVNRNKWYEHSLAAWGNDCTS